ncbi:MAG: hypothetical protein ABSF18_03580 [Gammaproteobacteria bacterium]|jgi:hypothetical protein
MSITTPQATAVKKSATQEPFFKEHAAKQKDSGLSRSAYCRKHQLNYDHFNYWFRKENRSIRQLVPVMLNQPVGVSSFTSIASPVLCTLTLRNGGVLQIHDKSILPLILTTLN